MAGGGVTESFCSAAQFARVYAVLQGEREIHTQQREALRRFLAASHWVCRGGAPWRFLPTHYGTWTSVDKRFARRGDLGVWGRLFQPVADEPDMRAVPIDATVIRARACAAGASRKTAGRRPRRSGARAAGAARRGLCWSTRAATR